MGLWDAQSISTCHTTSKHSMDPLSVLTNTHVRLSLTNRTWDTSWGCDLHYTLTRVPRSVCANTLVPNEGRVVLFHILTMERAASLPSQVGCQRLTPFSLDTHDSAHGRAALAATWTAVIAGASAIRTAHGCVAFAASGGRSGSIAELAIRLCAFACRKNCAVMAAWLFRAAARAVIAGASAIRTANGCVAFAAIGGRSGSIAELAIRLCAFAYRKDCAVMAAWLFRAVTAA